MYFAQFNTIEDYVVSSKFDNLYIGTLIDFRLEESNNLFIVIDEFGEIEEVKITDKTIIG